MENIQSYLNRFKNLLTKKTHIESCCEEVFKTLNMPISKKDFTVVGGVVRIKTKNPFVKSEIKLKKDRILEEINKKTGKNKIFDIH